MGWFTDHAVTKLFWHHKQELDRKPKTDNLQPNQPAGDASMANTVSINPQTLQALAGQLNAQGLGGSGGTYAIATTNTAPNVVYTTAVPQYYQYGNAVSAAGQPWAIPPGLSIFGYDPSRDAMILTPTPSRSEFTEEEIEQAERLMEELSA